MNPNPFLDGDPLDCTDFERRVHQRLDDRLPLLGDRILEEHAAKCSGCDALMRDYGGIVVGLGYRKVLERSAIEMATASSVLPLKARPNSKMVWISIAATLLFVFGLSKFDLSQFGRHWGRGEGAQRSSMVSSNRMQSSVDAFGAPRITGVMVSPISIQRPWERWPESLQTFSPYLQYTAELPGVRPMQSSVNLTIDLLQRSLADPVPPKPNVGWVSEWAMYASA